MLKSFTWQIALCLFGVVVGTYGAVIRDAMWFSTGMFIVTNYRLDYLLSLIKANKAQ